MSETKTLSGKLTLNSYGEADDILFCDSEPVAQWADEVIDGRSYRPKQVSLRYWISDREASKDEIQQDALEHILGSAETRFGARYSDITGYLWTDEDFNVGGHDMISRLRSEVGKYLILEIDVHTDNTSPEQK